MIRHEEFILALADARDAEPKAGRFPLAPFDKGKIEGHMGKPFEADVPATLDLRIDFWRGVVVGQQYLIDTYREADSGEAEIAEGADALEEARHEQAYLYELANNIPEDITSSAGFWRAVAVSQRAELDQYEPHAPRIMEIKK